VRLCRGIGWGAAALMGVAVAALPAIAGSETIPAITAENFGGSGVYEEHRWSPALVTIAPGGAVTFSNTTEVPHGVEWLSAVKPSCEEGAGKVPVGATAAASGPKWSGSCTFSQAGTYTFYCTVHGAAMRGTITVSAGGGATTTTGISGTTSTPGTTTTTTSTTGPPTLDSRPVLQGLELPEHPHGAAVHGSIAISPAGVGGRLEVDLLASKASLARAGHARAVRVGRLIRGSLRAGRTSFSVALSSRGRGALRRHHRLALTMRILLTPTQGEPKLLTRSLLLRS
jgi:plastocyanin